MWARRLIIGSSLAVASLTMVPAVAGASDPSCTMSETSCTTQPANTAATSDGPAPTNTTPTAADGTTGATSTSLPFTGADVEGLAVIGAGAVLAGGLLLRRRRSQA